MDDILVSVILEGRGRALCTCVCEGRMSLDPCGSLSPVSQSQPLPGFKSRKHIPLCRCVTRKRRECEVGLGFPIDALLLAGGR
jgi:hypothetical protein